MVSNSRVESRRKERKGREVEDLLFYAFYT